MIFTSGYSSTGVPLGDIRKMTSIKNRQFRHENSTWLRMLDYFEQENIIMKNRLAEILKNEVNSMFLEKLEAYQNKFLNKDTMIGLLRHEIANHEQLLAVDMDSDLKTHKAVTAKHEKLRKEIQAMEKEFNQIRYDFNDYLSEVLP